jgi:hypothetical protein
MSEVGGYEPSESSEADMINARNEATETNEMVQKGLLTPEEASNFDYENEIEIPEALLSAPPKISERLREQVMSKFSPESFMPENISGTAAHATNMRAIRPIWLGEGKVRTRYLDAKPGHARAPSLLEKGIFKVVGSGSVIYKDALLHRDKNGYLEHVELPGPIILILGKHPFAHGDDFDLDRRKGLDTSIAAVVLNKIERGSKVRNGERLYNFYGHNGPELFLSHRQASNYIAHCMVQGVDKSKIVPIYDWDGNLLWPRPEDVKKEKE